MIEGIKEATHAFLQRGEKVRKRALVDHPSPVRDMAYVYRKRTNAKEVMILLTQRLPPVEVSNKLNKLKMITRQTYGGPFSLYITLCGADDSGKSFQAFICQRQGMPKGAN